MAIRSMFLLFLGLFLLPTAADARTWLVSKKDPRGVKSFYQIDFDRLKPGDTVVVRTGVYKESLQAVTGVRYLARGKVYIDEILIENTFGVTIDGFRLDGDGRSKPTGISVVDSKSIKILNCRLRDYQEAISISRSSTIKIDKTLVEDSERGICLYLANYVTITRSMIAQKPPQVRVTRNFDPVVGPDPEKDENNNYGIEVSGGNRITIDHNTFLFNGAVGANLSGLAYLKFTNNILAFNGWGLAIEAPGKHIVENNLFYKNVYGDGKPPAMQGLPMPLDGGDNFFFDPLFVSEEKADWRLQHKSLAKDKDQDGSYIGAFAPLPPPHDAN